MWKFLKKLQPLLIEGREYFFEITKTAYGSTGGSIEFYENGILYTISSSAEIREHLDQLDDLDLTSMVYFFPTHSRVKFSFRKGEEIKAEKFTFAMYLEDFKNKIENDSHREEKTIKKELLVRFHQEADELGLFIDLTEYYDNSTMSSFDYMMNGEDLESIYHLVGGLESFYLKY
ncbi:hypothetical protein N6B72_17175 [Chryseobacterium soli]|uniref:hypothetical protein n=1 Tax=Chryseobacterium soli TaxID=445961 RepID=UPI0029530FCE|nr:hypothetical protein [Chryseobacterium soli]MDV7698659.1 hypothetical protein [Chryseobacterium soli]